jgi:hypothetical protein
MMWVRHPQPVKDLTLGESKRSYWLAIFCGIRTTFVTVDYDNFMRSMAPSIHATSTVLLNIASMLSYAHYITLECYLCHYGGVIGE